MTIHHAQFFLVHGTLFGVFLGGGEGAGVRGRGRDTRFADWSARGMFSY